MLPSGQVDVFVVSVPSHANVIVVHDVHALVLAPPVLNVPASQSPVIPWSLFSLNVKPFDPLPSQYLPAGHGSQAT